MNNKLPTPEAHRTDKFVGKSVSRLEDPRLLTGRGHFVDDIHLDGMLHAQFVRSSIAHGTVTDIDLTGTLKTPGVVAAFTAADLRMNGIRAELDRPPSEYADTEMPILVTDKVRFFGEPIAIVIATDAYAAEDGVEAASISYEEIPAVTSTDEALRDGSPLLHEEAKGNVFLDVRMIDTPGVDAAFNRGATVVEVESSTGRQNALPLETRAVVAVWEERDRQLVMHNCTQVPHLVRSATARSLDLPEQNVRVNVPDMGGGFGIKCVVGREEIATAAAARSLRRPVKWIEDRKDSLTASFLAREQHYQVRAAFSSTGTLLALDADVVCDMGAYSTYPFSAGIEPLMASSEMPGVYKLPEYRVRGRAIATNKAPSAPYRGVSRPQYVMVIERLMEKAAKELNLDPFEVRRRNLITEFPYTNANGVTYDPGSYLESLDLTQKLLKEQGWYDYQESARAEGRLVGIGIACFSERTGYGSAAFAQRKMKVVPGFDLSEATMDLDGSVTVTTGTMNHGQSHETTLAQIVADQLQIDVSKVLVHQGDTNRITYGFGTFASRTAAIGGSAVKLASKKLADRLLQIGAHLMDRPLEDIEIHAGGVRVRDEQESFLSYSQIAAISYHQAHLLPQNIEPGLSAKASYDVGSDGTFSNACHAAVTEVDPGTGEVRILKFICVEDCGVALNPQVVEGQARGGIAQGIAGALFEEITYDEFGAPAVTSFMDYLFPTASEIPDVEIHHLETPSLVTETGAKGAGEGGTIGAPATILNSVNDALVETGESIENTPITPWAVLNCIQAAERTPA
jgi:carbon-monoxide dehydrogenase large subunit